MGSRIRGLWLGAAVASALCSTPVGADDAPLVEAVVPQKELLRYLVDPSVFTLIDARSPEEFQMAHIAGAVSVPLDEFAAAVSNLPDDLDVPLVTYCRTGKRAQLLKQRLQAAGYRNVRVLFGEQIFWSDGLAVFNCAATAALEADRPAFTKTKGME